ncbi:unnamed protein product [Bemisia tabaci]|uniref:dolichyl-phosphate-mannose--protein mannosyltransferase n=1 Tax=Bemisia tabaci TaxID=7038 RepID=A0A9P0AKU7_BEMTA|nr:PREDICTED: transmembrane and TPR repeat-containing protein 4-like [Bemisia tabaci]CAH0393458.1 unnamed protein product [Bemisia tabaci]
MTWDASIPLPVLTHRQSRLVVGLLAVLCYVGSLNGDFVFDDSEAVVNNDDVQLTTPVWKLFSHDFWGTRITNNASHKSYRPLTVISFRWNVWLNDGKLEPFSFHLFNVILHGINSVLLLSVYKLLLGVESPKLSLVAASLFALHPVHTESVAGIVGRADLLSTFFAFISILVYQYAVRKENTSVSSLSYCALSCVFVGIAMLCKEQGITIISICCLYDLLIVNNMYLNKMLHEVFNSSQKKPKSNKQLPHKILNQIHQNGLNGHSNGHGAGAVSMQNGNRSNGLSDEKLKDNRHFFLLLLRQSILCFGCVALLYLRWIVMGSAPPVFQKVDNPASFLNNTLEKVVNYNYLYSLNMWILLCPEWLCFDWSMGCIPPISVCKFPIDLRLLAVVILWVSFAATMKRLTKSFNTQEWRGIVIALALLIIPFLPASNLVFRVGFVIAERVLYLPSAGFCLLVALGIRRLSVFPNSKNPLRIMLLLLCVTFFARTAQRSLEWCSESALFSSALSVCPLNAKVHYNLGKNSADAGKTEEAIQFYKQAIKLHPEYDQAMNNLANILKDTGNLTEARSLLETAVKIRPDFAAAWMNLGIVLSGLKLYNQAETSYHTALTHRRKYPDCYYNLGNLYLDMGRNAEAYEAWLMATRYRPTHTIAWSNMIVMLDSMGEYVKAEQVGKTALSILPNEPALHFSLANALGKTGKLEESEWHFTQAINLNFNNALYHSNFGVLYHRWKKFDKAEHEYKIALKLNPHLTSAKENLSSLRKLRSSAS